MRRSRFTPIGWILGLTALAGLAGVAGTAAGQAGFGPLRMTRESRETATRRAPAPLSTDATFESAHAQRHREGIAAARSRFPLCNLVHPQSHLGLRVRTPYGLAPARGAGSERDRLFRSGPAEDLTLGALARGSTFEIDGAAAKASVPGQDTIRVLVLRIDFRTDRAGGETTGNGKFDLSPPDTINVPVDPTPHGLAYTEAHFEALRRYYEATTLGRLVLEYEVYPKSDGAYTTTDMADFGPWIVEQSEDVFQQALDMFTAFTVAADTQGVEIPWARFDRLTFMHAGSDLQSDVNFDSPFDIPTFTIGVVDSEAVEVTDTINDTTVVIQSAMILPETTNQDGFFAAINAVNAHEAGHLIFGWRDVYNIFNGFPTCGFWSLMDTGNLAGSIVQTGMGDDAQQFFAIGILPPLTDPYQMNLVWDDVPRTDPPTWGEVDSLGPQPVVQRTIQVPISSEEYLLLENRRFDLNGDNSIVLKRDPGTGVILGPDTADSLEYDFLLPGEGIVVWHVDESVVGFDPVGRRADDFFSLNGNERKGLQIIEADGLDDLGDFTSPLALGSPFDPYFVPNNDMLASGSRPPLVTNSETMPHVQIEFMDTVLYSMRVKVSREWALDGWPVVVEPPPGGVQALALELAGGMGRTVVYAAGDSAIHAIRPDGMPGGVAGSVLWQAPATLSTVAELPSTGGALAAAVYPSPRDATSGDVFVAASSVVLLDGAGNPAAGFPLRLLDVVGERGRWITAGPIVIGSGTSARVLLGTKLGGVYAISVDGTVEPLLTGISDNVVIRSLTAVESGGVTRIAAAGTGSGSIWIESIGSGGPAYAVRVLSDAESSEWQPRIAWVELNQGAGGRTQLGVSLDGPQLVLLDVADGSGVILGAEPGGAYLALSEIQGTGEALADGLAVGDLDADGFHEIVLATEDGRVGFWNLNGFATPGWPGPFEEEGFVSRSVPVVADLGGSSTQEILAVTGGGKILALDRNRIPLPGWPLGTGAGQEGSPALLDVNGDGSLELVLSDADSLLYGIDLPDADATQTSWPIWGGDTGRSFAFVQEPSGSGIGGGALVVDGTLRCYPNPAKNQPLQVSFVLSEPADCQLTVYDPSGRQVADMSHRGVRSDNVIVWKAQEVGPGLYLGRLAIQASGSRETHLVEMAILR